MNTHTRRKHTVTHLGHMRAPGGAAGPKQLGLTLEIDSSCRRLFPCGCAVGRRGPNGGVWIQSGMCGASPRTMARGEATATSMHLTCASGSRAARASALARFLSKLHSSHPFITSTHRCQGNCRSSVRRVSLRAQLRPNEERSEATASHRACI